MKHILNLVVALSITSILSAQAPSKMSYQSVVRNTSGELVVNTNIGIKISILQGSAGGSIAYSETHIRTSNTNGLVSLEIGGGTPVSGTFSGINWANGPYFLKTEIDPTGGSNYSITGTSQLLSVPYALYAATAGNSSAGYWLPDANGIHYSDKGIGVGKIANVNTPISVLQANSGTGGAVFEGLSDDVWHTAITMQNNPTGVRYTWLTSGPTNTNLLPGSFGLFNHENLRWIFVSNRNTNNLGIGLPSINAPVPKSTLHVFTGDINVEQVGKGIIMKSPNGQCWRVTVANDGSFVSTAITCP